MNNIEIYQAPNGQIEFKGDLENETVWASLEQHSTVAIFATVQIEGERTVQRNIEYHNLDMILSIEYKVDSKEATKFRKWI